MCHDRVFLFYILYGRHGVCSQVISIFRRLQVNAESVGTGSTVFSTCYQFVSIIDRSRKIRLGLIACI